MTEANNGDESAVVREANIGDKLTLVCVCVCVCVCVFINRVVNRIKGANEETNTTPYRMSAHVFY